MYFFCYLLYPGTAKLLASGKWVQWWSWISVTKYMFVLNLPSLQTHYVKWKTLFISRSTQMNALWKDKFGVNVWKNIKHIQQLINSIIPEMFTLNCLKLWLFVSIKLDFQHIQITILKMTWTLFIASYYNMFPKA